MAGSFLQDLTPHLTRIRIPDRGEKIYKDECVFSFDNPESDTGLYLCLNTFLGLGREHVQRHQCKTGNSVFLHIRREKIEFCGAEHQGDGPEKKVTRLAIGVEGGFDPNADKKKFEVHETLSVVLLPQFSSMPFPSNELPPQLSLVITAVMEAESATKLAELEALSGTWDGEARIVTKHANTLTQLENGRRVPPEGWKCEQCDLTTNLWLNLTDGSILCGRKFFVVTGGNDHAIQHYKSTGYPLAVKLGTITKDGKGDVFSYDEDDMVEDPNLVQHLAHFGINIANMEKTEKSMVEWELELNQRVGEWSALQESGGSLRPKYGPGYTGLTNLGNSCYLNAVMQVMFAIPHFVTRYVDGAQAIFEQAPPDPANDFNVQTAKLGTGLMSGRYSSKPEGPGIAPVMFKNLIGKGHPDFATKKQQDAQEFFIHFITTVQRNSRHQMDPSECFKFEVEDRFECSSSNKVKYTSRTEYCLPLTIPLEAALNIKEVAAFEARKADGNKMDPNELVRPRIKLSSCLEMFSRVEIVEQFYSAAINGKTTARKTTRLASFPPYLFVHLKKFSLREDWVPVKLDVAVEMPDRVDLSGLRGRGQQEGEELLPELKGPLRPPSPQLDPVIMGQLIDMGFPPEAAKKAVFFTGNTDLESATNWMMQHIEDSDFGDTFVPPGLEAKHVAPSEEAVEMIMAMGFPRAQAVRALAATENNVMRAADWIFNHPDELDEPTPVEMAVDADQPVKTSVDDGSGQYRLVAFISHMGTSTMVGHYVCHILRENQWVIYNDEKVALSENPPTDLGYLYLYQRI